MKGEMYMNMNLKKMVKEGLWIFLLYSFITLCLFLATERIERLDTNDSDLRNGNMSVSINLSK